jgi:ABC-type dipeptide/oligopeptide/nickel transport system ATPase component
MGRSIILGVVGDSAAGKTTLIRGLVRVLGEENVTYVCVDDYHRYDRRQRAERNITPLQPECNHIDIMAQHLAHLRDGEPILKPVYQHTGGTFGPPVRVDPKQFSVVEGLLGYYTEELRRRSGPPRHLTLYPGPHPRPRPMLSREPAALGRRSGWRGSAVSAISRARVYLLNPLAVRI